MLYTAGSHKVIIYISWLVHVVTIFYNVPMYSQLQLCKYFMIWHQLDYSSNACTMVDVPYSKYPVEKWDFLKSNMKRCLTELQFRTKQWSKPCNIMILWYYDNMITSISYMKLLYSCVYIRPGFFKHSLSACVGSSCDYTYLHGTYAWMDYFKTHGWLIRGNWCGYRWFRLNGAVYIDAHNEFEGYALSAEVIQAQ